MKVFLFVLLLITGTTAFAENTGPTIYGKINKAFTHVGQTDAIAKANNMISNTALFHDVVASGSRLGVKGTVDTAGTMQAMYVMEIKFFPENGTSFSIRQGNMKLKDFWGMLTIGLASTTSYQILGMFDPLVLTTMGIGGDLNDCASATYCFIKNSRRTAYRDRSRVNLVGYETPVFAGLKYVVTYDRAAQYGVTPSSTANAGRPGYLENALVYDNKFGELGVKAFAFYGKSSGDIVVNSEKDWASLSAGASVSTMGLTVSAQMQKDKNKVNYTSTTTAYDKKADYMMATASYVAGIHTIGFTYSTGKYKYNKDSNTTTAALDFQTDTQIALGYLVTLGKNLTIHASAGTYNVKTDVTTASVNKAAFDNKANIASLGAQLSF